MYYRSGIDGLAASLHFHTPGGSTTLCEITSWLPFWN